MVLTYDIYISRTCKFCAKTGKLIDMVIVASFPTVSEVWVQLLENYDLSISQPQEPMSYFSQDRSSSSIA